MVNRAGAQHVCAPTDGVQADPGAAGSARSRTTREDAVVYSPSPIGKAARSQASPAELPSDVPEPVDTLSLTGALGAGVRIRALAEVFGSSSTSYPRC